MRAKIPIASAMASLNFLTFFYILFHDPLYFYVSSSEANCADLSVLDEVERLHETNSEQVDDVGQPEHRPDESGNKTSLGHPKLGLLSVIPTVPPSSWLGGVSCLKIRGKRILYVNSLVSHLSPNGDREGFYEQPRLLGL